MKNLNNFGLLAILLMGFGMGIMGGALYMGISSKNNTSTQKDNTAKNDQQSLISAKIECDGKTQESLVFKGGGILAGLVMSLSDNSFTVKIPDGSSKTVLYGDNTTYTKTQITSRDLLTKGVEVAVYGTANTDGSVTASNVQFNPIFFGKSASPVPMQK